MPAGAIIGGLIGGGMGLLTQGLQDDRAKYQNWRLLNDEMLAQREMYDFQQQKQYEMWLKTNYPAQVEQLKKAGLNPGLMYGMSGGGGTTIGGGTPTVPTGKGPNTGGELQQMIGMGLQIGTQQAQIDLMKAQADNLNADTAKKSGVDTEQVKMATEKLFQEWQNLRQTHDLQNLEKTMRNIENFEKQASQNDRLKYIESQTKIALENLKAVQNQNQITNATIQDQIKTIKQEAIYAVLKNAYTRAQTSKTGSDIQVNDAQMRKWSHEIMQGWDKMDQTNRDLLIKRMGIPDGMGIESSLDKILGIIF